MKSNTFISILLATLIIVIGSVILYQRILAQDITTSLVDRKPLQSEKEVEYNESNEGQMVYNPVEFRYGLRQYMWAYDNGTELYIVKELIDGFAAEMDYYQLPTDKELRNLFKPNAIHFDDDIVTHGKSFPASLKLVFDIIGDAEMFWVEGENEEGYQNCYDIYTQETTLVHPDNVREKPIHALLILKAADNSGVKF